MENEWDVQNWKLIDWVRDERGEFSISKKADLTNLSIRKIYKINTETHVKCVQENY